MSRINTQTSNQNKDGEIVRFEQNDVTNAKLSVLVIRCLRCPSHVLTAGFFFKLAKLNPCMDFMLNQLMIFFSHDKFDGVERFGKILLLHFGGLLGFLRHRQFCICWQFKKFCKD